MRFSLRATMIWIAAAPLALAGAIAGPAAAATAATSCSAWNGSQPASASGSLLDGVAVVTPCDVWAVGDTGSQASSLAEHWDGNSWSVVPTPSPGSSDLLSAASAVSASDVWSVGSTTPSATSATQIPLILHWDGSGWTQKPIQIPGGGNLLSVDARTASDAWAAGNAGAGQTALPLILHWNGTSWSTAALPGPATASGSRAVAISMDSAADGWAAISGADEDDLDSSTVMLRWDGMNWASVPFPAPASTVLTSVAAVSPTSAWAVGSTDHFPAQPVIMHWDGTTWNPVATFGIGTGQSTQLDQVVATSDGNVFVGGTFESSTALGLPLVLHWTGSSWTGAAANVPGQGVSDVSESIGVSPGGQVWMAGSAGPSSGPPTAFAAPVPVVPDVSGDQAGAANATLATFGLTGNSTLGHTLNCPASSSGLVVGQDPAAGQQEPFGLAVTLTVCDTPVTVTVPNVLGLDDTSARNAITSAGLTVGPVSMTASCTDPRGTVLTQNPNGGTQEPNGFAVSLSESTGKQANGRPCVFR